MQVAYWRQTVPDRSVVRSCDPLQNFGGSNHITGTAEPKVVKCCTRVGYVNSNNRMVYHQQKGRGYGHVTVLKFCRLSWCSTSRGFVSDSWATCCWDYNGQYYRDVLQTQELLPASRSIDGDAVAALAFDGCGGSGVASKVCGGLRVRAVANFFLQLIGCSGLMPVY